MSCRGLGISPLRINFWLSFSQADLVPISAQELFFRFFFLKSLSLKLFFWRFVLIASGAEIFWRVSFKFKLFMATSRFHCHRSNDSQHYLKILLKSAGQPRRKHEHGAKNRPTAALWACLAQFMFLFALDNPHSVKIHKISIKSYDLAFFFLRMKTEVSGSILRVLEFWPMKLTCSLVLLLIFFFR